MFLLATTPTFGAALRDVNARSADFRLRAVARLADPPDEHRHAALEALRTLSTDTNAAVRCAALRALAPFDQREDFVTLTTALDDPAPLVREAAAIALSERPDPETEATLETCLKSACPELRFHAIFALSLRAPQTAATHYQELLADPDPKVRANTVAAIRTSLSGDAASTFYAGSTAGARLISDAGAVSPLDPTGTCNELLVPCLEDSDRAVRWEAAHTLATLADSRGMRVLLAELSHRDRGIEAAMALAELASHGDLQHDAPVARRALLRVLNRLFCDPHLRVAAAVALIMLGELRGVTPLRRALRGRWNPARSFAVELAGRFRVRLVRRDLAELADRPRGLSQDQVAEALLRIPARDYLERKDTDARPRG